MTSRNRETEARTGSNATERDSAAPAVARIGVSRWFSGHTRAERIATFTAPLAPNEAAFVRARI